ncbi:MAG: T9SS type A sorting domain-containing protein [Flavobacteriales bacterium]|nr:T9SS type A sorting domain-containing protein [Flavobacteriales bacterium]
MKKLIASLFTLIICAFFSSSLMAQSPCDTCTAPWGPIQYQTITGKTLPNKPDTCLYTFIYQYRERNCGGNIEIDMVSLNTLSQNATGFCLLNNFADCYESRRAGIRSLVDFLNVPVTFSQEAACYALFEVNPPQDYIDCFLSPGEVVDQWYGYVKCDTNSCCRTTYTPNGNGTVNYQSDTIVDCSPGTMPNLPAFLTWECKGQLFIIPVDPNQPINCEATCSTGSGTLFREKSGNSSIDELDSHFEVYPNPTSGDISLNFKTQNSGKLSIRVFNTQGQIVYNRILTSTEQNSKIRIETAPWSAGLYTVQLEENGTVLESQKIQILK